MKHGQTIRPVVKRKLCTGCGTCAGLCPRGAITMVMKQGRYVPQWEKRRCNHCGLCHEACPGHSVDFEGLNDTLFAGIPEDIALGRYLACYVGHAGKESGCSGSASGGLISSLLVSALEHDLIDGALVTRMRRDNPLIPEPFIARTRDEILSAAHSQYCPVATNRTLREILESDGRIAVVGLPCQIQGIRKAEQRIPQLARQVRYRISLACSLNFSFQGTERFLHHFGIPRENVAAFEQNGGGEPGGVLIRLKDGTERRIPHAKYRRQLGRYSLRRCTLCSDPLGELSELTCGDIRIIDPQRDGLRLEALPASAQTDNLSGAFAISRTSEAEELLEHAVLNGAIELSELDPRDLRTVQHHVLLKKRKLGARMRLARLAGQSVPQYNQKLPPPTRTDYFHSLGFYAAR